jgi:hypothetical protein
MCFSSEDKKCPMDGVEGSMAAKLQPLIVHVHAIPVQQMPLLTARAKPRSAPRAQRLHRNILTTTTAFLGTHGFACGQFQFTLRLGTLQITSSMGWFRPARFRLAFHRRHLWNRWQSHLGSV